MHDLDSAALVLSRFYVEHWRNSSVCRGGQTDRTHSVPTAEFARSSFMDEAHCVVCCGSAHGRQKERGGGWCSEHVKTIIRGEQHTCQDHQLQSYFNDTHSSPHNLALMHDDPLLHHGQCFPSRTANQLFNWSSTICACNCTQRSIEQTLSACANTDVRCNTRKWALISRQTTDVLKHSSWNTLWRLLLLL